MSEDGDRSSAPPRALRFLIEELKAEAPPSLDGDRLEALLLARIDSEARRAELAPGAAHPSTVHSAGAASCPTGSGADEDDVDEPAADAEILVPWDDDPVEAELWKTIRRSRELDSQQELGAGLVGRPAPALAARIDRTPQRPVRTWGAMAVAAVAAVAALWAVVPDATDDGGLSDRGLSGGELSGGELSGGLSHGGLSHGGSALPVDLASVALAPRLEGALDLAGLRAGDVIEAIEGPVRFGREGILAWTLSAGGRLRVVTGVGHEEPRHVVSLEMGSLDVEVVPAGAEAPLDRFVVEVGDARVAVHGTAFRVVRSSQGVVVDVSRGVVAVGPRDGALGSGYMLEAPQRAAFALDGGSYRALPARSAAGPAMTSSSRDIVDAATVDERYASLAVEAAPASGSQAGSAPAGSLENASHPPPGGKPVAARQPAQGGAPSAPAPALRAADAALMSIEGLRQEVTACIVHTGAATSSDTRVSIASQLVVDVDERGTARAVRFEPPIRPDLQACAQSAFRGRFAGGANRLRVPFEVVLEASGN